MRRNRKGRRKKTKTKRRNGRKGERSAGGREGGLAWEVEKREE